MIIQGTHRTGDVRDRADVVVVGTGAGGATLAVYLAERGWDVVMLEKGGFFRAEDFTQREEDALADFNGRRGLDTTADNAIFLNYAEAVGGTTVHWRLVPPPDRLQWREQFGLEWMTEEELATSARSSGSWGSTSPRSGSQREQPGPAEVRGVRIRRTSAHRAHRLHRLRVDAVQLRVQPQGVAAHHDDPAH